MTTSGVGKKSPAPRAQTPSHAPGQHSGADATIPAPTTAAAHSLGGVGQPREATSDTTVAPLDAMSAAQSVRPFQRDVPRRGEAQAATEPKATSLLELRARAEDGSLDAVFQRHLVDFRTAFAELRKQAPSVVFFGGARLKSDDRYYKLAEAFGAALVPRGIPPKTGAGPGAMHAVPNEFIEQRDARAATTQRAVQSVVDGVSRLADLTDQRTQGFNIKLPAEQHVSPSIEIANEIQQFAFRKFALYENVRGIVVFPGGFGTIDELMEVLILKREGRTGDPIVLAGSEYWQPILDAWKGAARRNGADLMLDLLDDVLVTDDPNAALDFVEGHTTVKAFESDPDELYGRMVRELKLARYVATRQEKAVTILGGDRLASSDPALAVIREIAARVDDKGSRLRVGHDGQVLRAIQADAREVQTVLWKGDAATPRSAKPDVDHVEFAERIPHKEVLLRNSSAYVVLPCADRGKDELCSVLCQIQTGKLPPRPLVLVDEAYWKPIVDAWAAQMLGAHHAYIELDDLELVTYANTADEVMKALAGAL